MERGTEAGMSSAGSARENFGFWRTAEGRSFLKFAYGRYLELLKARHGERATAHGKVALVVADQVGKAEIDQRREDALTESALRRWKEQDQLELWAGKPEKSLRVLERLENLLSYERDIYEILSDRARKQREFHLISALSHFFYPGVSGYEREIARQRLQTYCGVFSLWLSKDRYNEHDFVLEDYCRYFLVENSTVLLFHEFALRHDAGIDTYGDRRCGFVHVREDGYMTKFYISYSSPESRWIELWRPLRKTYEDDHLESTNIYIGYSNSIGLPYGRKRFITSVGGQEGLILVKKENGIARERIESKFSGIEWDIPI